MINAVKDKISEVASGIKDRITGFFDIHSPSRVMRDQVGKYLPEGIAVGIDKGGKSALNSMDRLSQDLLDAASNEFTNKIPAMNALINGSLNPESVSKVDRYSNASNRAAEVYRSKELASGSNISDGTVFQIPTHVQIDSETIVKKTFKLTYQQIKQMQFTKGRLRGEIDNAGSDLW